MTSSAAPRYRILLPAALLALGAAGFAAPALSESSGATDPSASGGETPAALQELQAKRREIRQLTQELRRIEENATRSNPDLQADRKAYRDLVVDAMTSDGYDPEVEVKRIRSLQEELQSGSGDLARDERQAKTQELKQKKQRFRRKQQQAMQSEDVRTARRELGEKMEAAMKEQNPRAGEILAQLDELQDEYRDLLQQTIEQQGGGDAPQG